jgi:hypothetical protein
MSILPIPRGVPSPLSLETLMGAPGGIARDVPQHEIQDTECWMLQDANLMDPGFIRRRGPLTETPSSTLTNSFALGAARVQDPAGTEQNCVYVRTTTPGGKVYGFGNTSSLTYTWPYTPLASGPADLFCGNDALNGGVFLGSAESYDKPTNKALLFWQGASKPAWTNIATTSFARGATSITVTSDIAHVSSGHFVFDTSSGSLIGVVKTIASNVITLKDPALLGSSQIDVQPLRGMGTRVATGRITVSKDDTAKIVNGGQTKFRAQGLDSGTWDLYTAQYNYIGTVASVASDAQLTLASQALISLVNGEYIAIQTSGSYSTTPFGWLNANFAGHQFYADGNILRFSSYLDREAVDTTLDGDFITFSEDPIRALIPTTGSLVVVTENETFALVGAVGTTPDRWRGTRVNDDGTICGMSAVTYKGGAIWAGKRGIWFYDGASPVNIGAKLDGDYRLGVSTFTNATYRAYGAVVKDHYLLFCENVKSGVFDTVKGASTAHITRPTFVIGLLTGATSIWRNVELRGVINPPDRLGLGTALLPIQTLESAVNTTRVVKGDTLFEDSGQDAYTCNGAAAAGPDLYVESKKYSMGDGQRLKLFRMILLSFWAAGGNIKLDTIVGLNGTGVTSNTEFWATTAFVDKRIKFNARSQYVAVRLYQSAYQGNPASLVAANTTRITLGQWAFGFKWKRPGRV